MASIKIGDLVSCRRFLDHSRVYTGMVTDVKETQGIFSEKYAILETNTTVYVLCDGNLEQFDLEEDTVEIVDEN